MTDRSDMAVTKLLESGRKARQLLDKLSEPYLSNSEMANILCLICVEPSVLKNWTSALTAISERGCKWLYANQGTVADAIGLDRETISTLGDEADREAWLVPHVRNRFADTCRVQFAMKVNGLDALSQVGALSFDAGHEADKWASVNPEVWVSWARRGANALITGPVKSGKSNLALRISQYFLESGKYEVVSNILVSQAPEGYEYAPKLSTMLTKVCEARLRSKECLVVFDEGGLYWAKLETVRPRNIDLAKLVLTYGKMHVNMLYISHYAEMVPTIVAKTSVATFEKRSHKQVFVSISEGIKLRPRLLTSVPETTLRYSPDELQWFSIDMSLDELFSYISSIPEGTDQWRSLLEYVRRHAGEVSEEEPDPKAIARWLKKKGQSERQIASLVGRSNSTIHSWISEQKA